jgi:HlyD family secretion protein
MSEMKSFRAISGGETMKGWQLTAVLSCMFLLLVGSSACSFVSGQSKAEQPQAEAAKGDLTLKINGTGKTSYADDAKLIFGTAGRVEKVGTRKGARVSKNELIAKLNTDGLELALSQAKVGEAQSQVGLSQALVAQAQAEAQVQVALFNLDSTKDVSDIKDKITDIEWEIKSAETQLKEAQASNDENGAGFYRQLIINDRTDLGNEKKKLADLLARDQYAGTVAYDIMGQKYDRLTVADIKAKQRVVEASERAAEQAKQVVEQAQRSLDQASKAIIFAQTQLRDATIIAPFDGVVVSLDVKEGDFVAPPGTTSGTLAYLVDPSSLEIDVEVDEIDLPAVQLGQKAVISLDAVPDSRFQGRVTAISLVPIAKPQNTGVVVFEVTVGFDGQAPSEVKSGMSASVDIVTGSKQNVLLIPNKSIKRDSKGKALVLVALTDRTEERPVVLGKSDGTMTEIVSGLRDGDKVLLLSKGGPGAA